MRTAGNEVSGLDPTVAFHEDGENGSDPMSEPIRPVDGLQRALEVPGAVPGAMPANNDPGSTMPTPSLSSSTAEFPDSACLGTAGFSFLKQHPVLGREIIEVSSSSGDIDQYVVAFGCCDNPACDCQVLELWLRPLSDSRASRGVRHLRLDILAREVRCASPAEDADCELASGLTLRFTAEDWALAARIYQADKADHSEPETADGLKAAFPEEALADPSLMIQYQAVFPHARTISFQTVGIAWLVVERYCTGPDCDCHEVCLDIARVPANAAQQPHVIDEKDAASVIYDYSTGTIEVRKASLPGWPSVRFLVAALEAAFPELKTHTRRRHRVLRQLHRDARRQRNATAAAQALRPAAKVGRNDPCPCGSGKKHKRCCGR
jgi:hypothetical protein